MVLTKEQIQEIDNYISVCGIKYYDVRTEIVDHFASVLEQRLESEPNLNFSNAIAEEHKKFSDSGFKRLLTSKTNTVHKRFIKSTVKNVKSFFKLPKVFITIVLFYVLKQVMDSFSNKELFFQILVGIGVFIMAQLIVRIFIRVKQKKEKFLALQRTDVFLQTVNFVFISFNSTLNFRKGKSFENYDHNLIHLAFFVLLILFEHFQNDVYNHFVILFSYI